MQGSIWELSIPACFRYTAKFLPTFFILPKMFILNRRKDATERLVKFAEGLKNEGKKEEKSDEWRLLPVVERIRHSLVRGLDEFIEQDVEEARTLFDGPSTSSKVR